MSERVRPVLNVAAGGYARAARSRDMNQTHTELLVRSAIAQAQGFAHVDYDTLVTLTGYATAWGYHPRNCAVVYTPPAAPPWELDALIARGTGFGWEWLPKTADAEEAWRAVVATLDSGRPLQGQFLDDLLIVACQDPGGPEARRIYVMGGWNKPGWWTMEAWAEWVRDWGRLGRPTGTTDQAPLRDVVVESLRGMASYACADPRAGIDFLAGARFGLDGIEAYAAMLDDLSVTLDDIDMGWAGCHCVSRQYTGRRSAASFLRRAAGVLPPEAARHVLAAARCYAAAYREWKVYERLLSRAAYRKPLPDIAAAWADPGRRHGGAAAVRRACAREAAAAEEVRSALAFLGAQSTP